MLFFTHPPVRYWIMYRLLQESLIWRTERPTHSHMHTHTERDAQCQAYCMLGLYEYETERRDAHLRSVSSSPHITSGSAETGSSTPTDLKGWRGRKRAAGREEQVCICGEGDALHSRPPPKPHDSQGVSGSITPTPSLSSARKSRRTTRLQEKENRGRKKVGPHDTSDVTSMWPCFSSDSVLRERKNIF